MSVFPKDHLLILLPGWLVPQMMARLYTYRELEKCVVGYNTSYPFISRSSGLCLRVIGAGLCQVCLPRWQLCKHYSRSVCENFLSPLVPKIQAR